MFRVPVWATRLFAFLVLCVMATGELGPHRARAADRPPATPDQNVEERFKALEEEKELIRLFADTLEQVKSKYVASDVSDRQLIEAAIQGMISKLDPYSNYIPPQQLDEFRKGIEREYVGIGIQVSDRDGNLQITSPMFDTPAWRAGLRAGDRILKIDDTSTRGLSINDAVRLMSGEEGTEVAITVLHPDETQAERVTLKRERIQQPTVIGYYRDAQGTWDYRCDEELGIDYIRITAFSNNTARDLRRTLTQLLDQGMQALIVDLRFNPGGVLSQTVQVSDMFLHEGRIVSMQGRSVAVQTWDAEAEGTLIPRGFPVAVLVNRFTASAAEIFAASLQDNRAATIVGERTWGKGSVQNIIVLDDGKSALKLTTAGYHRPSGQNIHREVGASEDDQWGVHPDEGFAVRLNILDLRDLDILFDARDELTKVRRQPSGAKPTTDSAGESESGNREFVDRQMEKALNLLRSQSESALIEDAPGDE